jgi:hypothetical protein
MKSRVLLLIKFFEEEVHADAFLQRGEMLCRNLGYFKQCEEDDGRGDPYEGVSDWFQPDQIELKITLKGPDGTENDVEVTGLAGPVVTQYKGYDPLNLYCMFAMKIPEFEESFESEVERISVVEKINSMLKTLGALSDDVKSMGRYAVLVYKIDSFMEKMKEAIVVRGFGYRRGLVEYYDPDNFHGSFRDPESVFRKRNIYEYQSEYRFCIDSKTSIEKMFLHVGSLEGMAIKVQTSEINQKLQLKLAE